MMTMPAAPAPSEVRSRRRRRAAASSRAAISRSSLARAAARCRLSRAELMWCSSSVGKRQDWGAVDAPAGLGFGVVDPVGGLGGPTARGRGGRARFRLPLRAALAVWPARPPWDDLVDDGHAGGHRPDQGMGVGWG